MGKKGKRRNETEIERILRECDKKMRSVKFERKEAQCNCMHKSDGGKTWLRRPGNKASYTLRCKKCRRKIDFSKLKDKNGEQTRKYIKETFNEAINLCDMVKINISPKADKKYAKLVASTQIKLFQLKKIAKIVIADNFENHRRDKKHGGKKKGFTMAAGGSSIF